MDKSRALVIDDELHLRESLAEIMNEDFGLVETATDGPSAILKIAQFDPDIILTDFKMPGFDGVELIRRIRAAGSNIPVILVTAHADKELALSAIRLGVSDVLEKPFTFDSVRQCVQRVLQISNSHENITELKKKHGENSAEVRRAMKFVGLLQAANSLEKK